MKFKIDISKEGFEGLFDSSQEPKRELIFARLSKTELEQYLKIAREMRITKSEMVRRGLSYLYGRSHDE